MALFERMWIICDVSRKEASSAALGLQRKWTFDEMIFFVIGPFAISISISIYLYLYIYMNNKKKHKDTTDVIAVSLFKFSPVGELTYV